MAIATAGELFGYMAPGVGNTVEVPIILTDSDGAKVTGVAFDDAGMAVSTRKEGAHSYTAFPTFDTNNWAECGGGEYVIILRQSDAAELALMDTPGTLTFYVICTATAGDFAKIRVNVADSARDDQWTDARAAAITTIAADVVNIDGEAMRGTDGAALTGEAAAAVATLNDPSTSEITTAVIEADLAAYEATGDSGTRLADMVAIIRSGIAGRMAISGDVLTVYEADGSTVLETYTLAPAGGPYVSRTP